MKYSSIVVTIVASPSAFHCAETIFPGWRKLAVFFSGLLPTMRNSLNWPHFFLCFSGVFSLFAVPLPWPQLDLPRWAVCLVRGVVEEALMWVWGCQQIPSPIASKYYLFLLSSVASAEDAQVEATWMVLCVLALVHWEKRLQWPLKWKEYVSSLSA